MGDPKHAWSSLSPHVGCASTAEAQPWEHRRFAHRPAAAQATFYWGGGGARNSFVLWRTQSGLQSVPKAQGKASSMARPSVIDPARRNFGEPFFPLGAHLHKSTLELASQSKKANPCPKEPAILWNILHCSTASSRLQIWLSAGTSSPSLSTHCTQLHCGKQLVLIQSLGVGGKKYLILGR